MEQTYADTIRKYIESLHNGALTIAKDDDNLLSAIESFYFKAYDQSNVSTSVTGDLERTNVVVNAFTKLVLLTDMYVFLKVLACTAHIDEEQIDLREFVTQAINQEIYDLTLEQPIYITNFMETSIAFMNAPKIYKYFYLKLLDDDELDMLCIYNPLFEYELQEYNFELESDFILNSIEEMRKVRTYQDVLKSIVSLLLALFEMNEDYTIYFFSDMIDMLQLSPDEFFDRLDSFDQDYLYDKLKEFVEINKDLSMVPLAPKK